MRLTSHLVLPILVLIVVVLSTTNSSSINYDYESVEDYPLLRSRHQLPQQQQQQHHQRRQKQQHQPPVYRDYEAGDEDAEDPDEDVMDYDEDEGDTTQQRGGTPATNNRHNKDFPRRVYDASSQNRPTKQRLPANPSLAAAAAPEHDPLDDVINPIEEDCNLTSARMMATLNIMDRILIALGPDFGETLPKPPSDTLATVPTPINITAEPCPYKYKRCSSETFFPSCDIPNNTDVRAWSQRFNLYFNLSEDFERLDIINATLRLYKNNSIPLRTPKPLLIKAHEYTRALTRRRSKTSIVAEKSVSSDYIGWVSLNIEKTVRRWRKARNNHGLQISVTDADTIPWDATNIFVIMNCSSGLVPLPFEIQTDEVGQRYPALNVRQGSPDDEFPSETEGVTEYIQSDDPDVSDDEYESQAQFHKHSGPLADNAEEFLNAYPRHGGDRTGHHRGPMHAVESHRSHYDSYPYGTGSAEKEVHPGHAFRAGHEPNAKGVINYDGTNPHGAPHHEIPGDYLITNQATNLHHAGSNHHGGHHSRTAVHTQHGTARHHAETRHHTVQSSMEDTIQSPNSEEQMPNSEADEQREVVFTTEPPRPHRRASGNTKERRYSKKQHHRHPRRGEDRNSGATL